MGSKFESLDIFETSIVGVNEGDLEKLRDLYIEEKRGIFLFILSMVKDYGVAEDLLQDVFVRIIRSSDSYKRGTNAKAWILTIARNLSLNYLNRFKKIIVSDDIEICSDGEFEILESSMEFLRMIEPLSEIEKGIIILKLNVGLSYFQISKILGISIINARAKYSRAIKKLRVSFKEDK
ncbi:MAG: RNA polymerase sigma factor [Clostridium sp.]|uniref:RNA polymerase sigma factor n=1 Tax=Clostridium sp. TaxID=1506 RepID=UPI003EE74708